MEAPRLARILIYPIKSLPPVEVAKATILASGAIEHDRQFAICDDAGLVVDAKRAPAIHQLESEVDLATGAVRLARRGEEPVWFSLDVERLKVQRWLSEFFGQSVHLAENAAAGFPDDTEAPGPTVISTATLEAVASWFEALTVDEARLRFRANLEVGDVPPFWEDRLYAEEGNTVRFRVGAAVLEGTNPCQRCAVPTRHPVSGVADAEFAKAFACNRADTLPDWANASRFDHFYRLAVNTRLPSHNESPSVIRVGDEVEVLG